MEFEKEKTLCFTGHRIISKKNRESLCGILRETILIYIRRGYRYFMAGGAQGFDTMAANCVVKLRNEGYDVRLILVLPCRDQTAKWTSTSQLMEYQRLLGEADEVVYTSGLYEKGCMHKRNRYMVDNSNTCVAFKLKDSGGTAYTCKYAEKNDKELVNLGSVFTQLTID